MRHSDWSAERAVAAAGDFAELQVAHGGLLWAAFDPGSGRCRLFLRREGQSRELTPPGASVRSRVYEYGGGSCCATADGVAWVEEDDQQVRWLRLGGEPRPITRRDHCRYGDLHYVAAWNALLAVEEEGGTRHRIVRLDVDGRRRVIAEGADFYASPVADGRAERVVWVEWDRPHQPWTRTRLCEVVAGEQRCLAGSASHESIQQPRFDDDGRLHWLSDRDGYWQPCREGNGERCFVPADHAGAPWQLGGRTFLPLADGRLLATRYEDGRGVLVLHDAAGGERRLAPQYSRFRSLAADEQHFYCIAAAPERLPTLLAIRRVDGSTQVLAGGEQPLAEAELSRGEAFHYPVGSDECGHGFFYPPRIANGPPPLVVFLHGGPTSACYPVFDGRIQFWTQRGFAVADLNYRGSSGYGRAYRERLHLGWGQVEVEDIGAALAFLSGEGLACAGRIDRQRVFVRGASAGGYSALMALARLPGLRGGASLYGVSDPQALARVTHKFEADYLDWLIGDPQRDAERYRERTPVQLAGDIRVPVIFFQGELDAVVVPAQTDAMVDSLRRRGVPVEVHRYAGERHGFRQAANLAHALEAEWRFYQALLAV